MSFDLSEFKSEINKHGLAKNNLFVMYIDAPASLKNELEAASGNLSAFPTRSLRFFCRSVSVPELAPGTTAVARQTLGPAENFPTGLQYSTLPCDFMVDSNFGVVKYFHRWMQNVVNYDKTGIFNEYNGMLPFELGYKDEYSSTITVEMYSGNFNGVKKVYTYKFQGAYPTRVGEVSLAWANAAEIMSLPVSFSYSALKVEGSQEGSPSSIFNRGSGILSYFSVLNTYAQAIGQIRRPRNIQDLINQSTSVSTIAGSLL